MCSIIMSRNPQKLNYFCKIKNGKRRSEKLDNSKPNISRQYLHDEWITVHLEKGQNALIFLHTVGAGDAITHWYAYLISAAESADNKGNVYKIAGTIDMCYNWNDGLSIGLCVDSTIWARVSILYL